MHASMWMRWYKFLIMVSDFFTDLWGSITQCTGRGREEEVWILTYFIRKERYSTCLLDLRIHKIVLVNNAEWNHNLFVKGKLHFPGEVKFILTLCPFEFHCHHVACFSPRYGEYIVYTHYYHYHFFYFIFLLAYFWLALCCFICIYQPIILYLCLWLLRCWRINKFLYCGGFSDNGFGLGAYLCCMLDWTTVRKYFLFVYVDQCFTYLLT